MKGNFRCSGGDDRGRVSAEAVERSMNGWDDREVVDTAETVETRAEDSGAATEEELCSHF